ncbi:MAG: phosphoribosylformylglycinamidine synthase, partial [Candidatus Eisenbacteria bacterium]|nr:phosphoribosylformylglycinamidine synthase [Candidatus Eisenbacteria bacterium]
VLEHEGSTVCDASTEAITTGIAYEREARRRTTRSAPVQVPKDLDLAKALLAVVGSHNVASREHVFSHYDSEVKGNTLVRPGEADASVVEPIDGSPAGVAVAADGNSFLGALDPYTAGAAAVAEAIRNVAAVGAVPVALTDCLNFGNPEVPEVFHDFVESVRGIGDAARGIGMKDSDEPVPIVSGNVSFYNQSSNGSAVLPTPVVCCVGYLADAAAHLTMGLKAAGNALYLLGQRHGELGASEFARTFLGARGSDVPRVRFDEERSACAAVTDLAEERLAESCHDISEGGLVAALAEMMLAGAPDSAPGIKVTWDALQPEAGQNGAARERAAGPDERARTARLLFCENGGYVLEVRPENEDRVREIAERRGAWCAKIGETTEAPSLVLAGLSLTTSRESLERAWTGGARGVMAL